MKLSSLLGFLLTFFFLDQNILGVEVTPNEFPSVVDIIRWGTHYCTGSIISPNWIVTSAHCAQNSPTSYSLTAGEHNTSVVQGMEQSRQVVRVVIHPRYGLPTFYENDIALMQVEPPFDFNEFVAAANLPEADFSPTLVATLVGWGSSSEVLIKDDVSYVPDAACNASYRGAVVEEMVCYGDFGKDPCQGDSGSPLFCGDDRTLCGIASQAKGCYNTPGYLGVNAETSYYTEWMRSVTTFYPEDTEVANNVSACGGLVNSSSAVISFFRGVILTPGQRCVWVVQGPAVREMSRLRLTSSGFGNGSRLFATEYNVGNSSLGTPIEIEIVGQNYTVSGGVFIITFLVGDDPSGFILELYSSGFLPQPLTGFAYLSEDIGTYTYPASGNYKNGERALVVLNTSQQQDRTLTFFALDLENGSTCPFDAVAVYTFTNNSYNQDAR